VALGAFLIGAIMAEARQLHRIERVIAPVRDMFSAIFFVAIGLMLDPRVLVNYAGPIAVITVAVVLGKILACGLGTFLTGKDGRTSMRVGMGVAQIGEFSFIIASLGLTLKVTSDFLYPIAVAVSALTTLFTPYLIRAADPLSRYLARTMPNRLANVFSLYTQWIGSLQPTAEGGSVFTVIKRSVLQVGVNLALVSAIFIGTTYFSRPASSWLSHWVPDGRMQSVLLWGFALVVSLPFLVAVYRKLKALGLLLAEISVQPSVTGRFTEGIRRVVAELVPLVAMLGVFLLVAALSGGILPPTELLIAVLVCAAFLLGFLWRWFVKIHARLQIALRETLDQKADGP
jgi:CPA2 family monovalent cation:H+ antiporter-2